MNCILTKDISEFKNVLLLVPSSVNLGGKKSLYYSNPN